MAGKPSYVAAAIQQPGNIVFLALGAGLALLVGGTAGAAMGLALAGLETLYLVIKSNSKSFHRKVLRKSGWGGVPVKELDKLADHLTTAGAERYRGFRREVNAVVDIIEGREQDEDPLLQGVLANLQQLSLSYLKMLLADHELARLSDSAEEEKLRQQLAALDEKIAAESDAHIMTTLQQNRDLLAQRLAARDGVHDKRKRIVAQLDLLDSSARLLRDRAGDVKSPADITSQVDLAVSNLNDARMLEGELDVILNDAPEIPFTLPRVRQGE